MRYSLYDYSRYTRLVFYEMMSNNSCSEYSETFFITSMAYHHWQNNDNLIELVKKGMSTVINRDGFYPRFAWEDLLKELVAKS